MERIKLDEFLQYHFLSNVRLSPNAKKAAFVVSRANAVSYTHLTLPTT